MSKVDFNLKGFFILIKKIKRNYEIKKIDKEILFMILYTL